RASADISVPAAGADGALIVCSRGIQAITFCIDISRRCITKNVMPRNPLFRNELLRLDEEISRFGRHSGSLRLRIGEVLEALQHCAGHHELGFSSIGAYVAERCQRSGRWGDDSRAALGDVGSNGGEAELV